MQTLSTPKPSTPESPNNTFLEFLNNGSLAQAEQKVNDFCRSIDFSKCPKEPEKGVVRNIFSYCLYGISRASTAACFLRLMTSPSREYQVERIDVRLAILATVSSIAYFFSSPKRLSESELRTRDIYNLWRNFNGAYVRKETKKMRNNLKALLLQQSLFPKEFNEIVSSGALIPGEKAVIEEIQTEKGVDAVEEEEVEEEVVVKEVNEGPVRFSTICYFIKGLSYLYETQRLLGMPKAEQSLRGNFFVTWVKNSAQQQQRTVEDSEIYYCFEKARKQFNVTGIPADNDNYTTILEGIGNTLTIKTLEEAKAKANEEVEEEEVEEEEVEKEEEWEEVELEQVIEAGAGANAAAKEEMDKAKKKSAREEMDKVKAKLRSWSSSNSK